MHSDIHIGTAGWAVPRAHAGRFSAEGSLLQRYASRLHAVEVNTSFYRPHRLATWAGWAAQTPDTFRFAVKAPRRLTHELKLLGAGQALAGFVTEITALGHRLGPVLFQLPPSLAFDESIAFAFLDEWRRLYTGPTVLEPRHASWLAQGADDLLQTFEIARVAADPAVSAGFQEPGGWPGLVYWRWHGSPRIYATAYEEAALAGLADRLQASPVPAWAIFDNTMWGWAAANALDLREALPRCTDAQGGTASG